MPQTAPPPTANLVDALSTAAGQLDGEGRRIALATYRLLARGEPVPPARVAAVAGSRPDEVSRRFDEWPGVFLDGQGMVVGFWGLALQALDPEYRLADLDGRPLGWAWCAWDTLFLPALLGRPVEVRAVDGHTGTTVSLAVAPDRVLRSSPDTLVTFSAPDGAWGADVMVSFCHKVLFFAGRAGAEAWMAGQTGDVFALPVDEAFEVGREWIRGRYGEAVDDFDSHDSLARMDPDAERSAGGDA